MKLDQVETNKVINFGSSKQKMRNVPTNSLVVVEKKQTVNIVMFINS